MEYRFPISIPSWVASRKKPGLLAESGLAFSTLRIDQPRVRDLIMKLSKVYSATCHHRYWSER
jgi:hypothetical protein